MPSLTTLLRCLRLKRKIYPTPEPGKPFHVLNFTISAAPEHNGDGEMRIEDSTGENRMARMTVDLCNLEEYVAVYAESSETIMNGGEEEEGEAVITAEGAGLASAAGASGVTTG